MKQNTWKKWSLGKVTSIGASAAPALSNIPFVGWVAAGWVTMFSGNQGAEIGGQMAEDLNKNC